MKYRLKPVVNGKGDKFFIPQVKRWFGWVSLTYSGIEITWINKYKSSPYLLEPALYKSEQMCNTSIELHKETTLKDYGT